MTPAERLDVIRAKLGRAVAATSAPKGMYCASHGQAPLPRKRLPRVDYLVPKKEHGHGIKFSGDRFKLVHISSGIERARSRSSHLEEPRGKGPSPLTAIAEKWLDRDTFAVSVVKL